MYPVENRNPSENSENNTNRRFHCSSYQAQEEK